MKFSFRFTSSVSVTSLSPPPPSRFSPSTLRNANNSEREHWIPLIKKSSHHPTHALRALCPPHLAPTTTTTTLFTPSFLEPPTPPPSPHPKHFFSPLQGGTLRKNVIQHIQASAPPNLCCKHVPTDSPKELIAPNNLTIWLLRSVPTRLLALQRLGPIQRREGERGRGRETEREVVKACQEAERRRE